MGAALLHEAMAIRGEMDIESYDRLFPAQDYLPRRGFGNLIALPLEGYPPGPRGQRVLRGLSRAAGEQRFARVMTWEHCVGWRRTAVSGMVTCATYSKIRGDLRKVPVQSDMHQLVPASPSTALDAGQPDTAVVAMGDIEA
jgi:hypothetical protein